jgi:hypothetical protein
MPVRITNRSRGLLTIELNSGATLHLAPGETSEPVEELEVADNRWVNKLRDRDQIEVAQPKGEAGSRGGRGSRRGSPRG